jgi:hypothetical protein
MTLARMKSALESSESWKRRLDFSDLEGIPNAEPSLGLISKLLLDEALRGFFSQNSKDFWVRPNEVDETPRRELARILEVYDDHGWLDDPASFHTEPPPLEDVTIASGRRGHHRFEHLRFESGYEPHLDDPARERWLGYRGNRTAHAWLLRHTSHLDRPWLICLHGIGMGTPYMDFPAFRRDTLHEKLGFNVLWYVKPFHGPRGLEKSSYGEFARGQRSAGFLKTFYGPGRRGTTSHETYSRGIGNLIQVQAQTMWDLRRIISWIQSQGGSTIGAYGLSLGGYAASLLSSLVDDLDVVVAGIPGTDFIDLLEHNVPPPAEGQPDLLKPFWRDARRAMRVVSPLAMPCRVPKEHRYIFGGLADRLTPPRGVHSLWRHWEEPRIAWYPGSHVSFLFENEVTELLDEAFGGMRDLALRKAQREG